MKALQCLILGALAVAVSDSAAAAEPAADAAAVTALMTKDLVGVPGKEVVMLTVGYLPGGASLPHRHEAQVFVYVLEGSIITQVDGQPPKTLKAGETFYESPQDIHRKSANASTTQAAKFLVFMIKDKNKPASIPVPAG
ncbi:MAG TPA: cupin domain-containing protein [Steroidobacteraceae bacterium]|jgi:quercetin dioxygenase-like cupin family protein